MFQGENDRVKLLVLYSGMFDDEVDERLIRAASGALATLTCDRAICHKVTTVSRAAFSCQEKGVQKFVLRIVVFL